MERRKKEVGRIRERGSENGRVEGKKGDESGRDNGF